MSDSKDEENPTSLPPSIHVEDGLEKLSEPQLIMQPIIQPIMQPIVTSLHESSLQPETLNPPNKSTIQSPPTEVLPGRGRSLTTRRKVYANNHSFRTNLTPSTATLPKRPLSFRETSSSSHKSHKYSISADHVSASKSMVSFSFPESVVLMNQETKEKQQHRPPSSVGTQELSRQSCLMARTEEGETSAFSSQTDVQTLLTYTKCFLIAAYFVFLVGSGITLNELIQFLIDPDNSSPREEAKWIAGVVLIFLAGISILGLYGALKEESCILLIYGSVILIIFVIHVCLLFHLKNACTKTQKKCYRNMATPPGLAPILVAISELAIAMAAYFMVLVIESERKSAGKNPAFKTVSIRLNQETPQQSIRGSLQL